MRAYTAYNNLSSILNSPQSFLILGIPDHYILLNSTVVDFSFKVFVPEPT